LGQVDAGLIVDQVGVGGPVRLGAHVVLVYVGQPGPGQRRYAPVDDGGVTEVAGAGDQAGGHRYRQVVHAGVRFGEMGVGVEATGPGVDLEHKVGQVDPRDHGVDQAAQLDERRRFALGGQLPQMDMPVLDRPRLVAPEAGRHRPVALVQVPGQAVEMFRRFRRQLERLQHRRRLSRPLPLIEQLGPRVTPAPGAENEHVPSPQRLVEVLGHGQGVGPPIDQAVLDTGRLQDKTSPRAHQQRVVDLGRRHLLASEQIRQDPGRRQNGLACIDGPEWDHLDQGRPERAEGGETLDELGPFGALVVLVAGDQLFDDPDCGRQLFTADNSLDGRPHLSRVHLSWQGQEHPHAGRQPGGGS
jgi:hypothetical protein